MVNKKLGKNTPDRKLDKSSADVQFFPASRKLEDKTPLTNKSLDYVLKEANSGIAKMGNDYITWAEKDIIRLENAFEKLKKNPNDKEEIMRVHWISHDMKGQGGTFGYTLMTTVLDYLCTYLEKQQTMSDHDLDVTDLHIEATKTIINNRLTETGGEIGKEILQGLHEMIDKKNHS